MGDHMKKRQVMMMQRIPFMRTLGLGLGLVVLLVAAGCFQPAGSGFESPGSAELLPTFTPFLPPTDTPVPNLEDLPILDVATETRPAILFPSSTPEPVVIAQLPTATPPVFVPPTIDPALLGAPTQAPAAVIAQANPFELTATYIVGQATLQAAIPITQTAEAIFGVPTVAPGLPTVAPGFPTATSLFPAATAVPGTNPCQYTVVTGDNLYRLSLRFSTTVAALASANGIANINVIREGQVLNIPNCSGGGPVVTTVPGQSTGGCSRIHVVDQGETLFAISLQYNVRVADIAACSGIADINRILIGQELRLP
jgi:LysM repeat protein